MRLFAFVAMAAVAACQLQEPPVALTGDGDLTTQAVAFLDGLQPLSIRENREYCGFLGRDGTGQMVATAPVQGTAFGCEIDWPEEIEVLASYHTHAAFDQMADSEVPSSDDVAGDMSDMIDGYVSTPGGRVWRVDGETGVARQVCGVGCVFVDPEFVHGRAGRIEAEYSLEALRRREGR